MNEHKKNDEASVFLQLRQEITWMMGYIHSYWWVIVFYILLGILSTVIGLVSGIVSKYLVDAIIGHDRLHIAWIAGAYIGFGVGKLLLNQGSNRLSVWISLRVNTQIRADIYDQVMATDWESVSHYHSGDLLNRLNGDVGAVSASILNCVPGLITQTVQCIGAFCIIFYYDWIMALITLITLPFSVLLSQLLLRKMRHYDRKSCEMTSDMIAFNQESFQNLQTIKSFNLMKYYGSKLRKIQKGYVDMSMEFNRFSVWTSFLLALIGLAVSYICYGWGIYRLWNGAITYGTMMLFLQMASSLSVSLNQIINLIPGAISATISASRIMEITELPREKDTNASEFIKEWGKSPQNGVEIHMKHMNFSYMTGQEVFHQVDFHAGSHEIVALLGPSGEGKTTFMRILLGLLNIQSGDAYLSLVDDPQTQISLGAGTRPLFAYVPQGNTIFSGTVAENLRMVAPEATDDDILHALKMACADQFVLQREGGIYAKTGEQGKGFSEGQAQRLAIARALLCKAPVLLLDEASAALDVETEKRVLQNIMSDTYVRTCILTTHRQTALKLCNHIYTIRDRNIQLVTKTKGKIEV